ncbi:MAG: hypothetical protein AVDCRST_MAG91-2364 [uncultured Sphingomonadaceae bacterium]|uniref:Uncharacterized protein n=1 Tax=uncultured Sphingomonadaceae bacterium TaxID=169976 RepID=A0A6J4TJ39_9SPHN|nr:MAG: hypothetical protein AVDCRST_MAG91-2364 [uncultured Sphingomonadaceae bacterium]
MQWVMQPFDDLMRGELVRASFDFERPQPSTGWSAFKSFVAQPLPGHKTLTVGFACSHAADRDSTLWLEFARQLEDEVTGIGHNCGCAFSRLVPADLSGIEEENWWWSEHGTVEEWFRDVEAMPEFKRCVELDGWRFEGYSL